jgi:hypothetical protein
MSFTRKAKTLSREISEKFGELVTITGEQVRIALDKIHASDEALRLAIPYVNNVANEAGLEGVTSEGHCKRLRRMFYKAVAKHDGQVEDVPDVGRFRLLVNGPDDIEKLRTYFFGNQPRYYADPGEKEARKGVVQDKHPANKISIIEVEDYYHVPSSTGRMALHLNLEVKVAGKDTVRVEVQVLHKDMVKTEDATRENYMEAQKIRRMAERENRELTEREEVAIESYDSASRDMYFAGAIQHDLIGLRRNDLAIKAEGEIRARASRDQARVWGGTHLRAA